MNTKNTRRGFTLIELLVVVLIIGILAAVAVPQYQKAVWKSRTTEALQAISTMEQQIDLYLLENGLPTSNSNVDIQTFANVDVSTEKDGSWILGKYHDLDGYCNKTWGCTIMAVPLAGQIYALDSVRRPNQNTWTRTCYTCMNSVGRGICEGLKAQGWDYEDDYF